MIDKYTLIEYDDGVLHGRDVVYDNDNGYHFMCPCGKRQVYIKTPPHRVTTNDGVIHVEGSIGSRARKWRGEDKNWCHFHIHNGIPTMCSDALCPGKDGI